MTSSRNGLWTNKEATLTLAVCLCLLLGSATAYSFISSSSSQGCDCDNIPVFLIGCRWTCLNDPCPTYMDNERLSKALGSIVGQEEAIKTVKNKLLYRNPSKALILHFYGPNGVGKTTTMQTLIHNIFSKKVGSDEGNDAPRRGALILHGNELKTYNDQEIHKIILKIANNVRLCPRFFLIIEEFLEAPKLMLDFLDILSSGEYCPPEMIHQCISTTKMTIILLSDLGPMTSKDEAEQIQKGTLEKDVYLDIINQRKDAARLAEQPLSIYFKRMPYVSPSDLNIHTVPESIVHIIRVLLESKSSVSPFGNIKSLKIVFPSEDGLKKLAVELYKKVIEDESLIIRNFRAIDQVFDSDFFPVVIEALEKLPLNTIHVTVSCSFDGTLQCTAFRSSQRVSNEP